MWRGLRQDNPAAGLRVPKDKKVTNRLLDWDIGSGIVPKLEQLTGRSANITLLTAKKVRESRPSDLLCSQQAVTIHHPWLGWAILRVREIR